MAVYAEYLDKNPGFKELQALRQEQLARISQARQRDVLVFAADLNKNAPVSIRYDDLLPISDALENLSGDKIDLIIETPGGSGEVAEDIVRLLREKYDDVAVIVPGYAKSAGTIIAMAADDILMGKTSALGPIDAQLSWQGKSFSADALLQGFEKIKDEVTASGGLNRAYVPILQGISPGELQKAQNALDFAKVLVKDWLARYKFRRWEKHSSDGRDVTDHDRKVRAEEIATELCSHSRWLTHGRSLRIADLEGLRLRITNYELDATLADAIRRYYVLLQMTFATNCYKLFETPGAHLYRFLAPPGGIPKRGDVDAESALFDVVCSSCGNIMKVQANLDNPAPITAGHLPFPADGKLKCTRCTTEADLADFKRQIEGQTGKRVVT